MYRVLLVEDEERIRKGLRAVFPWEKYGCVVAGEAENGQEGIEQIRALRPDIVLTDISMPIVNGIDMLAQTIEEYRYAAIVLTVYSDFEYARSALKLGAIDYLMKPLQNSELAAAIEKAGVFCTSASLPAFMPPPSSATLITRSPPSIRQSTSTVIRCFET